MVIATIFVALFCTAFIYDMLNADYDIPSGIYPLLTTIIGAIFGFVYKRTQNDSGN